MKTSWSWIKNISIDKIPNHGHNTYDNLVRKKKQCENDKARQNRGVSGSTIELSFTSLIPRHTPTLKPTKTTIPSLSFPPGTIEALFLFKTNKKKKIMPTFLTFSLSNPSRKNQLPQLFFLFLNTQKQTKRASPPLSACLFVLKLLRAHFRQPLSSKKKYQTSPPLLKLVLLLLISFFLLKSQEVPPFSSAHSGLVSIGLFRGSSPFIFIPILCWKIWPHKAQEKVGVW